MAMCEVMCHQTLLHAGMLPRLRSFPQGEQLEVVDPAVCLLMGFANQGH